MNKIMIALASLTVAGCGMMQSHVQPIKTEYRVVIPEDSYFVCDVTKLPNPKTLTDAQVAQLINDLYRDLKICHNNIQGIKTYLQSAQDVLSKK